MAHTRSSATVHIVSGSAWVFGGLAMMALFVAWSVPFQAPFVGFWILGLVLFGLGAFELAVGLRSRRLGATGTADAASRHARRPTPAGADPVVDGGTPPSEEPRAGVTRLSGSVNIVYGAVGLLTGVVFLLLNLSDPAGTDGGDWFWCAVGFVVGVFLLRRGVTARRG